MKAGDIIGGALLGVCIAITACIAALPFIGPAVWSVNRVQAHYRCPAPALANATVHRLPVQERKR